MPTSPRQSPVTPKWAPWIAEGVVSWVAPALNVPTRLVPPLEART